MQALAAFFAGIWAAIKPFTGEIAAIFATAMYKDKQYEAKQQKDRADALQSRVDTDADIDTMSDSDIDRMLKQQWSDQRKRKVWRMVYDNC